MLSRGADRRSRLLADISGPGERTQALKINRDQGVLSGGARG